MSSTRSNLKKLLGRRLDNMMRHISLSITALLISICISFSSGFSTPKLTNNRALVSTTTYTKQSTTLFLTRRCRASNIIPTHRRMTNDDNEKIEEKEVTDIDNNKAIVDANGDTTTSSKIDNTKIVNGSNTKAIDNNNKIPLILLPTLLFKFTIVMLVKFATDIVVFPFLWSYRLIRMCKRKLFRGLSRVFGRGDKGSMDVKVNGDNS